MDFFFLKGGITKESTMEAHIQSYILAKKNNFDWQNRYAPPHQKSNYYSF